MMVSFLFPLYGFVCQKLPRSYQNVIVVFHKGGRKRYLSGNHLAMH